MGGQSHEGQSRFRLLGYGRRCRPRCVLAFALLGLCSLWRSYSRWSGGRWRVLPRFVSRGVQPVGFCAPVLSLLLLLSPLLLPRAAFASYAVGGPFESAQDAALSFLGYSLDDIPNGVITWFSYSTTDGGEGTDSLPNYADFAYFKSTFHHAALDATQWYTDLDGYLLADAADKARSDVRAALKRYRQSGQESGGGTSQQPTQDGEWVVLSFPLWYGSNTDTNRYNFVVNSTRFYFNSTSPQMRSPVYVRIKKSAYDSLTSHDGWFIGLYSAGSTSTLHLYLGYVEQGSIEWTLGPNDTTMRYFKFAGSDGNAVWHENVYSLNLYSTSDDELTLYRDVSSFALSSRTGTQTWSSYPVYAVLGAVQTGGGTSDPDPTPTPDPDPTPSPVYGPVELPDPVMYPVTDIHITNHETGDTIYDVDFTSEVDLSPVTERQETIIRVLDQIGIDLWDFEMLVDDHFNTLFWWLRLLYDSIQGLDRSTTDLVDTSIMEHTLSDILDELRDWPETGGVDVDLSTLENELEDFHIDFNSFWEELMGKLDTIIYDLEHLTVNSPRTFDPRNPPDLPEPGMDTDIVPWEDVLNITALRDALTRLMTKFPFATINDIALLFAALVRPAVAPEFDLPVPNPSDWANPHLVNIDLSIWDVPAAVLRYGILLWATVRIVRRTMNLWLREEGGGDA